MNLSRLSDLAVQLQKVAAMAEGPEDPSERAGMVQAEMRRLMPLLEFLKKVPGAVRAYDLLRQADLQLTQALVLSDEDRLQMAALEIELAATRLEPPEERTTGERG
jgi:hypothetical protein